MVIYFLPLATWHYSWLFLLSQFGYRSCLSLSQDFISIFLPILLLEFLRNMIRALMNHANKNEIQLCLLDRQTELDVLNHAKIKVKYNFLKIT